MKRNAQSKVQNLQRMMQCHLRSHHLQKHNLDHFSVSHLHRQRGLEMEEVLGDPSYLLHIHCKYYWTRLVSEKKKRRTRKSRRERFWRARLLGPIEEEGEEKIPMISAMVRPFVNLPLGNPLPKSIPYHGRAGRARLLGRRMLLPTSNKESPKMNCTALTAQVRNGIMQTNTSTLTIEILCVHKGYIRSISKL